MGSNGNYLRSRVPKALWCLFVHQEGKNTTKSFIDSKFCELSQFDFEKGIKDPKYV